MTPGPVVEDFNVIEDIGPGQILGFIDTFSDPFFFQRTEERFGHRIILPDRRDYSIIFPYGWEKKQLTREMRRMFPRKTGRRVLIMLDELHQFIDSREKQ